MNTYSGERPNELTTLLEGDALLRASIAERRRLMLGKEARESVEVIVQTWERLKSVWGDETKEKRAKIEDAVDASPDVAEAHRRHLEAWHSLLDLQLIRLKCQRLIAEIVEEMLLAELTKLHPNQTPTVTAEVTQVEQAGHQVTLFVVKVTFQQSCQRCMLGSMADFVGKYLSDNLGGKLEMSTVYSVFANFSTIVSFRLF